MDVPLWLQQASIVFFLIILSAYFSSSETALTTASKAKLHKLKKSGNKRAKIVNSLRADKNSLISTILIGNNLVNILASAIATKLFLEIFGDNAILYATAIMTVIVVIFAEVIPKTYALHHSEKISLAVAPIMRIVVFLLKPFVKITHFFSNAFLPKKKEIHRKKDLISAIEELRAIIELHHQDGSVDKADRDMLDSVLDLSETEVVSIMTHRKNMFMVNADEDNKTIIENILKSPYTRIPVWQGSKDNIIGILHVKDILKAETYSTKDITEIDFLKLATKPWFIPETTSLRDQLLAFRIQRNHFAVVVDEYGSVMGIVTLEDILEEIVGDIKDEHDKGGLSNFRQVSENSYLADGAAAIRDFNREYDLDLPEDDASTLAGLLIYHAEKIPDRNESFDFLGFKFTALEKHKNQITKLKITKMVTDDE